MVALGATAGRAIFGHVVAISRMRGRAHVLADGTQAFVTIHPSFLLRIREEADKAHEFRGFVADLRIAGKGAQAARRRSSSHAAGI